VPPQLQPLTTASLTINFDAAVRALTQNLIMKMVSAEEVDSFAFNLAWLERYHVENFQKIVHAHADDLIKKGQVDLYNISASAAKFTQRRKKFAPYLRYCCDMLDITAAMQDAWQGLYLLMLACKHVGAIKPQADAKTVEYIYENRFRFLKNVYQYRNYDNFKHQCEQFSSRELAFERML
jgi:hypothetical protein